MHALVAAVLLGMAGLDAFDGDPESEPPDGELGEIEQTVRTGERDAIVGTDRRGQAAFLEELLEGGDGGVLAGRFSSASQSRR
jgi:hypothetical protein